MNKRPTQRETRDPTLTTRRSERGFRVRETLKMTLSCRFHCHMAHCGWKSASGSRVTRDAHEPDAGGGLQVPLPLSFPCGTPHTPLIQGLTITWGRDLTAHTPCGLLKSLRLSMPLSNEGVVISPQRSLHSLQLKSMSTTFLKNHLSLYI